MTVAWVDGAAVDVSEVDHRETGLRAGPVAATLPRPGTSEGRQLRRWLVQVLVAERLVAAEAAARGVAAEDAPDLAALAPTRAAMLGLGSVAADLLARNPLARAVFRAVTAGVEVTDEQVGAYYAANPEKYREPERRLVRHALSPTVPADCPVRTVRRGELPPALAGAVFAATPGSTVGPIRDVLGTHTVTVVDAHPARVRPLAEARPEIVESLLSTARRRAFTAWLDRHVAERVRLAPGYEHPGDPRQPDNTHRH